MRKRCKFSSLTKNSQVFIAFSDHFRLAGPTLQGVREARGEERSKEARESPFSVRLESLHYVTHGQREHDSVDGVRDALGYLYVFFVLEDLGSIDRCDLQSG